MAKTRRTAVVCQACRETVLAEDINKHEESEEHRRRRGPFILQAVVNRQMGWQCPGRPFGYMLPSGR